MPKSKNRRQKAGRPRSNDARPSANRPPMRPATAAIESNSSRWSVTMLVRLGWVSVALGGVIFFQHLFSHMGFFVVLGPATDDLLIGYPTAGALIFVGAMALGRADK